MVFPWMFDQYASLAPLKEAAHQLAEKSDWQPLYKEEVLANNQVPLACAVYAEDMFVDMMLSRHTLAKIPNASAWITNEFEHNGIRTHGKRILDTLIQMADKIENQQSLHRQS